MSESSAESSGGSKRYSASSSRSDSPRELKDFSSEEEASSVRLNVSAAKAPGSGLPKLKTRDSKNVSAQSNFPRTWSHPNTGEGSGTEGRQGHAKTQLSVTSIESSSSSEPDPWSPGFPTRQKRTTDNDNDNDNDNDIRYPLINKDTEKNASRRDTGKKSGSFNRAQTLKARTKATATTTTTTNTTTTTTTTTTTATTVPVYRSSGSGSDKKVASSSSQERKPTPTASTKEKRRSYIALSVQPDQQSIAAVKNAESISGLPSGKQKKSFEETLGVIEQMRPDSRCAPLVKLAHALVLLDSKEQAVYLPRLRKLASPPMSVHDRKKVIDALLCAYAGSAIDGTDSDHDSLDGEDLDTQQTYPLDDAKVLRQFQQQVNDAKLEIKRVNAPVKQRSTDSIKQVMQNIADSRNVCLELEYAVGFLEALDSYEDNDKKAIFGELLNVFGDEIVATALLLGSLGEELEKVAGTNMPRSAMLAGFIEGNKSILKTLEDSIAILARKKLFLNVFIRRLHERSIEMSTPGKNNPRLVAAIVHLLMDMAASSQLPEASRCLLVMHLYSMDPKDLFDSLSSTRKQHGETGFEFAHRVIATAIGVSVCSMLLPKSANDKMAHLASYQDRVDAANGKQKQPRLPPRGKHLRTLLLDSKGDAKEVKKAVGKVLASSAEFDDKLALLKALETTPLTDDLPAYVEKSYIEKLTTYLDDINPGKCKPLPEKERLQAGETTSYDALYRIHKKLPQEKVKELRKETREAHDKALNSTLPAVHAAIMSNNVEMVKAYLDAVLDPNNGLSSIRAAELISMPHNGKSAFYRALMRGTPDMIRTFIETILASKLDETHKINLLLARRGSDNFGAFYIAMSSRSPERVEAFMEAVLASDLLLNNKEKLLRCEKELGKGPAASRNKISKIYSSAQLYARSEAARNEEIWASREQKITAFDKISYGARKLPSKANPKIKRDPAGLRNREEMPSLVALFDDLIDKSNLDSSTKELLKDKRPNSNLSKQ